VATHDLEYSIRASVKKVGKRDGGRITNSHALESGEDPGVRRTREALGTLAPYLCCTGPRRSHIERHRGTMLTHGTNLALVVK
jgi:hypothetical protein